MGITVNNWQFYVILCSLIGCYVCGQLIGSPFQEPKQCNSSEEDVCENGDCSTNLNKEPVWEDTGYIVAAKESNHPGVKQGDVIILSPEEIEWVGNDEILKNNGKRAQVKEIQDGMMLCHLVFDLNKRR